MPGIMEQNKYFLNAWLNNSPMLKESLYLEQNYLVFTTGNTQKALDLSVFYLPDMLHNEHFRTRISTPNEVTAEELFEIITCYIETNKILTAEQKEYQMYPEIIEFKIIKKEQEQFISFTDAQNRKYRFDTENPEFVLNLYNSLKQKMPAVTLKTLKQSLGYPIHDDTLTRNDFYSLIQKENRTPEEEKSIERFTEYLEASKRNEENLSDFNCEILHNAIMHTSYLVENNSNSQKVLDINRRLNNIISFEEIRRQKEQDTLDQTNALILKREKKAGYTNAVILLYVVLNLGLFLACLLLMM